MTQVDVSSAWYITGDLNAQNGSILKISVSGLEPVIHVSGIICSIPFIVFVQPAHFVSRIRLSHRIDIGYLDLR